MFTHRKDDPGFGIQFPNGLFISVWFGKGSHSTNYNNSCTKEYGRTTCPDAEVMIRAKDGTPISQKFSNKTFGGVIDNVTPIELLDLLNLVGQQA